ncbi:MAG: flagellar basal-body MS-ring/collar protein FliF [Candidatus Thiodiazotropha sp.]
MLKETWQNSGLGSRSGLIGGAVLIIALTFAAAWWLLQNHHAVLFTDLEPGDAASVVSELERMKVNYKLAGDGTRIMVPQDRVHEIRLKLLGSGLPLSGGVGFEIFDKAEFGMTEFAQRINFQRAMQGELTRTITSLKEVKYARVHLVMPEASLFQQNKTSPSASITLFLKPGAQLDRQQIEGIQRLVSASVQRLEAHDVTILDQYGKTLSALVSDVNEAASVTTRLQKKQEVEAYLTEKVARVLGRTFGLGKAIVSINVTLNYDQSKTTREEVIPGTEGNSGVVRKRESHSNPNKGKNKGQDDVNTEVEYRLGRSVAQIISSPGGIERLSVGVLVPTTTADEQLRQIEDLVAMAVGLNPARGDAIAVHASAAGILPEEAAERVIEESLAYAAEFQDSEGYMPASTDEVSDAEGAYVLGKRQPLTRESLFHDFQIWMVDLWAKQAEIIIPLGIVIIGLLMLLISGTTRRRRNDRSNETSMLAAERETHMHC